MKRLIFVATLLLCLLPLSFQTLAQSSTATPYPTYTMYPTYTQFPATDTPSITATLSATDRAQLKKANATATREQYYTNLTATADSRIITRTAVADMRTSTAESIQATRTFVALYTSVSLDQLVNLADKGDTKAVIYRGSLVNVEATRYIVGGIVVDVVDPVDVPDKTQVVVYGVVDGTATVTLDGTDYTVPYIKNAVVSPILTAALSSNISQQNKPTSPSILQQNLPATQENKPTQVQPAVQPTVISTHIPVQPTVQPAVSSGNTGNNQGNGATALCNDGTYSFAAHHQGACSHHGGVKVFYK